MEIGLHYPPLIGSSKDILQGMAGQRTELYQRMLKHLVEQAQYADENGYYGFGFSEHHLNIEGITVSNNPAMLDLYIAAHTKHINVGELGFVLPAHDPLRVASDIAVLDQMSQGRAYAGFVRGIQERWLNTFGQHFSPALADNVTDLNAHMQARTELFDESVAIIRKAFACETFSFKGKHWQIPAPKLKWTGAPVTREIGKGVDENDRLLEVGLAPRCYNNRMPTFFEPFAISTGQGEEAATRGSVPVIVATNPPVIQTYLRLVQQGWAKFGRTTRLGEGVGLIRYVLVADTDAEAQELAADYVFEWLYWFDRWKFSGALAQEGEDPASVPSSAQSLMDRSMLIAGSPSTVCRQLEKLLSFAPVEYLWLFMQNESLPQTKLMRSLELMTTQVWPHFTDRIGKPRPAVTHPA
ncbi:MAG: LLM class flavin-dependent oxidoreductase [Deltaproteobacteria bacterium]|nr:LLM class flavin-dependent oxidoreductase [Deltaproteobacteria bacterium]